MLHRGCEAVFFRKNIFFTPAEFFIFFQTFRIFFMTFFVQNPSAGAPVSDSIAAPVLWGKIGIIGISGRMGQRLIAALEASGFSGVILGYDLHIPEKGAVCATLAELFERSDVLIDFSGAGLFPEMMHAAIQNPKPLIMGTTGVDAGLLVGLNRLAESVPVVFAPNTSFGGVIQRWLAKKLAGFLPENYDIDIVEIHHRHKKDTPSGTATALAGAIAGVKKEQGIAMTLGGGTSPREKDRIEMHALRCGNIPGKHEVIWTSLEERIVIEHQVFSPDIFATGAVSILKWLSGVEKPGLYTMEQVLGLDAVV